MSKTQEITAEKFFQTAEPHSIIKSDLVSEYIIGWANIIIRSRIYFKQDPTVAVIDLFSGPGLYDDKVPSTPIKVLENTVKQEHLRNNIKFWFNDESAEMITRLQRNVSALEGIVSIRQPIAYTSFDADSEVVAKWFSDNAKGRKLPIIVFIDPFGYRQINQGLLRSIIQVPQSDILMFFNFRRINAALENDLFESNMNRIFGEERVRTLKGELGKARPLDRPEIINRHLAESLKSLGANYVISFKMVQDDNSAISHYIVGITKHPKGFELLKKVMKKHTKNAAQTVSRFGHDLFSQAAGQQQLLFQEPADPIGDLCSSLRNRFSGQTISFGEIYRIHHPTAEFTESEYKDAIRRILNHEHAYIDDSSKLPTRKLADGIQAVPDYLIIRFLKQ